MRLLGHNRRRRGVILVLVLWMVIILSLIAYSLLFQVTMETSMTSARKKQVKAEALARGGAAKAVIDLKNDLIFDFAEEAKPFDAEGDVWARPEEEKDEFNLADEIFRGDEESGYFSVRVYDEDRRINLNRIGHSNRMLLEKIIEKIGYNEDDAKLVATAIVDWRDSDSQSGIASSPSPDEGIAYAVYRGEDNDTEDDPEEVEPIVLRNEDYLTVDELLEVYGVTPDLYFGPGTPEAEHYNRMIGISEGRRGERFRMENNDRRRRDDEPILGLRDYFTVYGNGVLNINTAEEHVLDILADASGAGDEGFGERVLKIRRGGRSEDFDNDDAFEDMTELMAQGEVAGVVAAARALYPIGVQANTFRIVSYGVVGDVKSRVELLVHRQMIRLTRDESFEFTDRAEERRDFYEGRYDRRQDERNEQIVNYPFVRVIQALKD
jgi:type II secretory pathway component PulK